MSQEELEKKINDLAEKLATGLLTVKKFNRGLTELSLSLSKLSGQNVSDARCHIFNQITAVNS